MDKLKELMSRCKATVYVSVNDHLNVYETAAQRLEDAADWECPPEIEPDVRAKIIETNTLVEVHFYPDTPVGSYMIWHYDLDAALDQALACFDEPG